MHSPAWSLNIEDDGMMHHPVYDGGGDDWVAEIIAKVSEVNVCCEQCRSLAVATVDDFEEQRGVS